MKNIGKKMVVGALAMTMCMAVAGCGGNKNNSSNTASAASGYFTMDINPSLEVIVRDGKVTGVKAGNNDANVLISGVNFVGMTVEEASEQIVKLSEDLGYLNDTNKKVKINVVADDANQSKAIGDSAKAGATSGSTKAEINEGSRAKDERTLKKLQAENPDLYKDLTAEKLRLIESIMPYDETMTYEIGAKKSVSDLLDILEDHEEDYEDMVSDELEDKFEAKYDAAKFETEKKIAAVYGEEYLAAWERYTKLEVAFDKLEDKAENLTINDEDIVAILNILKLEDKTVLADENGNITIDSIDEYFDKNFDDDDVSEEDEEAFEALEDQIEEILDKYDEDSYVPTEEDLAEIKAAFGGELPQFKDLDELEELIEAEEEKVEELEETIQLTQEQKSQIEAYEKELKELKKTIREEMKTEIEAEKAKIAEEKQNRLEANK